MSDADESTLVQTTAAPMDGRGVPALTGRVFYGWVIVAASFVQLMVTSAFAFYGLAIYLRSLNEQRGFSITSLSFAIALFWLANGAAGVIVARYLARVDPRWFVAAGAVVSALCISAIGRVTELWQVFGVYIVFGAAYACTAVLITNTLVTRFFHRRRSVALSVATTGLSVGGIVLTPIATHLLSARTLPAAMDRIALMELLGVLIIPVLLLRPTPESLGLAPDGDERPAVALRKVVPGVSYGEAITTVTFVALTVAFMLALLGQVGGISQIVKLATERAGKSTGNRVVSVLAFCSVCGRLVGGAIVQRRSTRQFAFVALTLQICGLTVLAFASTSATVLFGAGVFGLGVGNVLLLHPLLIAEIFGVRDYPRIYSRSQLAVAVGIAFGPLSMGWLRDHAGGYRTSYLVAVALSCIGVAVFAARGRPPAALLASAEFAG
jgi:MFS family permease